MSIFIKLYSLVLFLKLKNIRLEITVGIINLFVFWIYKTPLFYHFCDRDFPDCFVINSFDVLILARRPMAHKASIK